MSAIRSSRVSTIQGVSNVLKFMEKWSKLSELSMVSAVEGCPLSRVQLPLFRAAICYVATAYYSQQSL